MAGQDYANLEYIVIDGGSADGSLEVIERHAADITRWVSEPDRGIYDAMNKGVAMATGDYCIFMNAGDTFVAPDTVNTVVAGMERGDDVVYGDIVKNGVLKPSPRPVTATRCSTAISRRSPALPACSLSLRHGAPLFRRLQTSSNSSSQGSVSCIQFVAVAHFRHARCVEHATLQRTGTM